ncbi:MAG: TonB-dependent receptor plug domain-containing protein, partial [Pseudomonadota bacterium]
MLFSRLLPAAALVLLSGPSLATEPDTIVVTAARTPLSLTETGASVTVITRDDIERRQSRYVSDLLRSVPGFSVSRSGGVGTQTQLRVRGAEANHLLVLINGVQANDPAGGDEARLELLSTAGVERIEIVRGPQSASWGSEAVGGVVNIITRRDVTAGGGSLRAESGSNDTLNVAGEVAGRIGDLALTLAADRLDTDGSNVSRSGEERDGADLSTLSLFADYAPSGPFSAALMLRHAASDSDFDPTDFAVTGLPVDGDLSGEAERNHAGIDLRFGEAGARLGHRVTAGFLDTENRSFSAGAETGVTLAERLQLGYQLDAALGGDTISIGVDREDTDFEQRGPIGFGDPNQRQS